MMFIRVTAAPVTPGEHTAIWQNRETIIFADETFTKWPENASGTEASFYI
jgi:hypothetical protein